MRTTRNEDGWVVGKKQEGALAPPLEFSPIVVYQLVRAPPVRRLLKQSLQ